MLNNKNVGDYIIEQEALFKTERVHLADNWDWNMWEHIQRSFLVKNSKFWKGDNNGDRPFENIVLPILNVAYRSEGFDVKDIVPYVNDIVNHFKSFLVKKFHPKWARENKIDTFIDEMVESYTDYGLAYIKNVNDKRPEVVPLQSLAFCDQTDILSGPSCIKHNFSPDQLLEMAGPWYKDKIDMAIEQAKEERSSTTTSGAHKTKTPGKYIEVYELHGTLPAEWLNKEDLDEGEEGEYGEDDGFVKQLQVITFYKGQDGNKKHICLYKGKERKERFKAIKRDAIFGRACGRGAIEELFEPQVWTNYSRIQVKEMLDVASKILLQTADKTFVEMNNVSDLDNGDILEHAENKPLTQVSIQPYNKQHFDDATERWARNARNIGSADEALLGENPASGTPFSLQALIVQEGRGIHDYRRGKVASFTGDELYPDWVMKYLVDDINEGQEWLEDLTPDEMVEVTDALVNSLTRKMLKDMTVKGRFVTPEEKDQYMQQAREGFSKGGTKKFLQLLKDEVDDIPVDVYVNVAGKQKDLKEIVDKLTNIFRQIFADPTILQQPGMASLFNQIIESSGMSPINFAGITRPAPQAMPPGMPGAVPGAPAEAMAPMMPPAPALPA